MQGTWRDRLQARLFALTQGVHISFVVLCGGIVVALDYVTGPDFSIILFYVLTAAWSGWWVSRPAAFLLSGAMGAAWAWVNVLLFRSSQPTALPLALWNALMVVGTCLLTAYALGRLRRAYDEQRALNVRLQAALDKIHVLEGLVPICAWCKSVRTESGAWVSVESFLARETPAQLTHSICPNCATRVSG